jgi:antitoxin (DNA-binding transcriptional repressor) of toxin-antitoxin stability system
MEASITDLRYKTREILKALDRSETVDLMYHGKLKGRIVPAAAGKKAVSLREHPFFGSWKDDKRSVEEIMTELRKPRY